MTGKLTCGVGVYKKGKYNSRENGKITKAYSTWSSMLMRCYDPKYQARRPTYIGCEVCDEWLEFQSFAKWFEENYQNDGEKYHLDKDLTVLGNKTYSPEACLFLPQDVNKFTNDNGSVRGKYLIGVSFLEDIGKFQSHCCNPLTKKKEYLGRFTDELQAHLSWRKRKSELAYELAITQGKLEVRGALLRWKDALDKNSIHTI